MAKSAILPLRSVPLGLVMSGLWIAAFFLALLVRGALGERLPVASLTAALMIAAKPLADRGARWSGVQRGPVVTAISWIAIVPLMFLGTSYAIHEPLISSHWRCGTGDVVFLLTPFVIAFVAWLGSLGALFFAKERKSVDLALRVAKWAATGGAAVLFAGATLRAVFHPDVDRYLESIPVVADIPPIEGAPAVVLKPGPSTEPTEIFDVQAGDITVRRICTGQECYVRLGRNLDRDPAAEVLSGYLVGRSYRVLLRFDAPHGLYVVDAQSNGGHSRSAYKGEDLHVSDLAVPDVADTASPPLGWIAGAGLGLAIAAWLHRRRRVEAKKGCEIGAAASGTLHDSGWITFDDGAPSMRATPDGRVPVGPVTIFTEPARADVYRDGAHHTATVVLAGDKAEHLAAARARLVAIDGFSLAALVITSTPLVTAALSGLVY